MSVRVISDLERGVKLAPRPSTLRLLVPALQLSAQDAALLLQAAQGHSPAANDRPPDLATNRHNLPRELSSFFGREQQLAELPRVLASTPLLTLTGPGGVGKTRLALRLAADVLSDYPDGVWLVDLAPLVDPNVVQQAVANAVGVRGRTGRSLLESLQAYFRDRTALVILDNCEHLVQACADLTQALLRACPALRVLATSRERLDCGGELTWQVPPLAVPDAHTLPPLKTLVQVEAVRLFAARARATRLEFSVTAANATAVAEICRRLDGVPLALELAAALVSTLSPEELAARLEDRFRLLVGGSRTLRARQQTLRATVEWSYDLLSEPQRLLLDRTAVFARGWSLQAVEAVCADDGIEVADVVQLLGQLVARSLVLAEGDLDDDPVRFGLLETLRQYGWERLLARGDASRIRQRHAAFFLALAEAASPYLSGGPHQVRWMQRLERERDNLRTALRWCLESERVDAGLRLGGALWWFWLLRGSVAEGRDWCDSIVRLARSGDRTPVRARALDGAGALASQAGDVALASTLHEESLAIWRELGDLDELAGALNSQGWAALQRGDWTAARALLEEALTAARAQGDVIQEAITLNNLGRALGEQGDDQASRHRHALALALFRELGDCHGVALSLSWLSHWGLVGGDRAAAIASGEEALRLMRTLDARRNLVWTGVALGLLKAPVDMVSAHVLVEEGMSLARARGESREIAWSLEALAGLAIMEGRPERTLRLAGAAAALEEATGYLPNRVQRVLMEGWLAQAREMLDEHEATQEWATGRASTVEWVIADALAPSSPADPQPGAERRSTLTTREQQVAALVARGLSNRQIAAELVVAERTVDHHVEHILAKIGVRSRAAAAAYAERIGLTSPAAPG